MTQIEIVRTPDGGTRVEPRLEDHWTDIEKLQWKAAVVSATTDRKVTVETGNLRVKRLGIWRVVPGQYDAQYADGSSMLGGFREAWSWLNGFAVGSERETLRWQIQNDLDTLIFWLSGDPWLYPREDILGIARRMRADYQPSPDSEPRG